MHTPPYKPVLLVSDKGISDTLDEGRELSKKIATQAVESPSDNQNLELYREVLSDLNAGAYAVLLVAAIIVWRMWGNISRLFDSHVAVLNAMKKNIEVNSKAVEELTKNKEKYEQQLKRLLKLAEEDYKISADMRERIIKRLANCNKEFKDK